MNVISVLQRIAAHPADDRRQGRRAGRLGLQLPGGSLRRLHDADQRPRAAGLLRPGRSTAGTESQRDRTASDQQVPGDPRSDGGPAATLFQALRKTQSWIAVDGYHDMGPGPHQSQEEQEQLYPLSQCMSCGCCLEACPQYTLVEVTRLDGETGRGLRAPRSRRPTIAPSSVRTPSARPCCSTRIRRASTCLRERLDALIAEGGIQNCGNAQNCVKVCPKHIPLTTSIARPVAPPPGTRSRGGLTNRPYTWVPFARPRAA